MRSGHGVDQPGLSPGSAALRAVVAVRRLPSAALRLIAALVALAILALSLIGGCAAEPSAEPTVRSFLLAWQQARYWQAAGFTTGSRSAVAAALQGEQEQLGAAGLFLNMERITVDGDHADARFTASVDLGRDGAPWQYEGEFMLRRVGTGWKVVWSPAVINPNLRPGLRLAVVTGVPARAPVLDSAGQPLARLSPVYVVGVTPQRLADPGATASGFARVTGLDADQVLSQIRSAVPDHFHELLTLSPAAYRPLQHQLARVRGLQVHMEERRLFSSAAHEIVGTVETEDAPVVRAEGLPYQPGSTVGVSGLQQVYQNRLTGTPSTEVVVEDARGHVVAILQDSPGQSPLPVRTTIDSLVQAASARAVGSAPGPAALVAVQASTGHILAVSRRAGKGESMADAPLEGRFPPGEGFTIVSGAALLSTGVTAGTEVPCADAKQVGGETFTNDQPEQGIGPQPKFSTDFARGCGTAFAGLSRLLTAHELTDAANRFGIGAHWQLPLPAFTGSFPPPDTDAQRAAATIGEGGVQMSPLDMALVAAEIQSGSWHQPVLVTDPPDPASTPVTPFGPGLVNQLRDLMRGTVVSGAGHAADLAGQPVFGQVGSAPFTTATGRTWANWFVGFRGDIAFAVLTLGNPATASAAPVAADFLRGVSG